MSIETLTSAILRRMPRTSKWRFEFFQHFLRLYLSLRGRYTFSGFSRWGSKDEHTYRKYAIAGFDFATFNRHMIEAHFGEQRLVAFAPSYISKSGKRTPGVGYFWSGCAGKAKWGLELCGFAAVDVVENTALHYFAEQTLPAQGQGLMGFYVELLGKQAESLKKVSNHLAVDAFFSKKAFVDAACQNGLQIISRLRDDAVLHHQPPPKMEGKQGRPKKYGDRIDLKKRENIGLPCVEKTEQHEIYGGKVWVKSLKRWVVVAIFYEKKENGEFKKAKVFFSTDLDFGSKQVLLWYKSRFQIEFLFRDAKQHAGLEHCQSRDAQALKYHFNMALTAVSVAKAVHNLSIEKAQRPPFSMADIKTQYFNELIVNRVFEVFANHPNIQKNSPEFLNLYHFGRIAA